MFEEIINLAPLGHARTRQIKKLLLETHDDINATYSVYTDWPGYPDLSDYMLITTDPETNDIVAIDFDAGPYLSIGDTIKDKTIVGFTSDKNFSNVKVILTDECANTISD